MPYPGSYGIEFEWTTKISTENCDRSSVYGTEAAVFGCSKGASDEVALLSLGG